MHFMFSSVCKSVRFPSVFRPKRVVIVLIFYLTRFFSVGQHWFGIVMILQVITFIIQMSIILPFELAEAGHVES